VPQRTAFRQTVEFLRKIFGVIADALERLGGEQDVEILLSAWSVGLGQMSVKQGMAQMEILSFSIPMSQ
jgi:hypothetical protein